MLFLAEVIRAAFRPYRRCAATASLHRRDMIKVLMSDQSIRRVHQKKGSSRFAGKGILDLQEEIGCIPKSVGHALDDLDAVVDAFEDRRVHRVCLLYTSPSPRDLSTSRMPSSA